MKNSENTQATNSETQEKQTFGESHTVKCNNCDFSGFEEDLEIIEHDENLEINLSEIYYINVCPNCGTDYYLMDI